jgi:plastocyanin
LAGFLTVFAPHAGASHFLDFRAADPSGEGYVVFLGGSYKIAVGETIRLTLTDSEGHTCSIAGVDALNPAASDPPPAQGRVTCEVVCTEEGEHEIYGHCPSTGQQIDVQVRVVHMDLFPDPVNVGCIEICQNRDYWFWIEDYNQHEVWLMGLDSLDPYCWPAYYSYGYVGAWAHCSEVGWHTVSGWCFDTNEWDYTYVWVWPTDLKPDPGVGGFH